MRLATEQIGGARGLVVEQLSKEHPGPPRRFSGLTSYQAIY
jgi:hypothetical protein